MEKKRIVYLDMVRIIACILVVLVHVSAQWMERMAVPAETSAQWIGRPEVTGVDFAVTNAFHILAFSGVSLFVMISGALALNPNREEDLKTLLVKRTLHFFVLYYIWKFFFQIVTMLEKGIAFTPDTIKEELILALVKQRGYYHLWYLPMIAILYMAVPFVKKGFADKKICRYFLAVFFITALLFPTLFLYEFKFKYLFVSFFEANDFSLFGGYLGYFVLGHYLHNWRGDITVRKRRIIGVVGLVSFVLACVLGTAASRQAGEPVYSMQTPFVVTNFLTSAGLFCVIQGLEGKLEKKEKDAKCIAFAAGTTLGIYLLHPLVLNLFLAVGFNTAICSPILSVPLVLIAAVLVSGGIAALLLKVPGLRKLIT